MSEKRRRIAFILYTEPTRAGGFLGYPTTDRVNFTDGSSSTSNRALIMQRASRLTWLCCCCWSLSWRIACASPPVTLLLAPTGGCSVETVRTMSVTDGQDEPAAAPFLSLKRPRDARIHMGNTDVADMLEKEQRLYRWDVWGKDKDAPLVGDKLMDRSSCATRESLGEI